MEYGVACESAFVPTPESGVRACEDDGVKKSGVVAIGLRGSDEPARHGGHLGVTGSPLGVCARSRGSYTPVCDVPHFGQTGTIGRMSLFSYSL